MTVRLGCTGVGTGEGRWWFVKGGGSKETWWADNRMGCMSQRLAEQVPEYSQLWWVEGRGRVSFMGLKSKQFHKKTSYLRTGAGWLKGTVAVAVPRRNQAGHGRDRKRQAAGAELHKGRCCAGCCTPLGACGDIDSCCSSRGCGSMHTRRSRAAQAHTIVRSCAALHLCLRGCAGAAL